MMLPPPEGPYEVGLTTFGAQVPKRFIGKGLLKSTGQPAIEIQEVVFSVFYPTALKGARASRINVKRGAIWAQRPFGLALRGWSHFLKLSSFILWPVVYTINTFIKIPVFANPLLLSPNFKEQTGVEATYINESNYNSKKWPLVIFSHGLGGSRTGYSNFCSQLASDGNVVLSMEHHDGTGVYTTIRSRKEASRGLIYLSPNDVDYDKTSGDKDNTSESTMPLRIDQLELRREEVYTAYFKFRQFVNSPSSDHGLYVIDDNEAIIDLESEFSEQWKDAVRVDEDLAVAGHSFGAATMLSVLSNPPPPQSSVQLFDFLPITKAIVLDPWLEPFPTPGPFLDYTSQKSPNLDPPHLLIINGEGFSLWSEHFERVEELAKCWAREQKSQEKSEGYSTLLLLPTALHMNFSDFPLFLPRFLHRSRGDARQILSLIHDISVHFLQGRLHRSLNGDLSYLDQLKSQGRLKEMEVEILAKKPSESTSTLSWKDKRMKGNTGDVVLHL